LCIHRPEIAHPTTNMMLSVVATFALYQHTTTH
jgi:hypothetical protein